MVERLMAVCLGGALLSTNSPARAEGVSVQASVQYSFYQQKLDALAKGGPAKVFLGTASVAPNRRFPWVVSIGVKGVSPALGHFCGGVVVDASWVLTAAHCVSSPAKAGDGAAVTATDAAKIQVLAGSNVLAHGGHAVGITKIVLHPELTITMGKVVDHDFAMLQLAEPLNQAPIKIATEAQASEFLKDDQLIRTLGWGTASFAPNSPLSNNLLYAFTKVVANSRCNEPAVFDGTVKDSMFCAGVGTSYACEGDSGGPAVGYSNGDPYLLGLVSWGYGCGSKFPTVYADVVKHAGWVYETIGRSR
jgi:trypsin